MRVARQYRSASVESFKRFREEHPHIRIGIEKFRQILYTFSFKVRDYILETGEEVRLPHGMGVLTVGRKKTRRLSKDNKIILPVDWVETLKRGKKVYNFNDHTEGWKYKWRWEKNKALFRYSALWSFKPSRTTSRRLAEYLKKPNSKYYMI